jgi:DNA repair exonuclease SbcCD ATPase subunit
MKLNRLKVHNFITYKDQTFDFNKMFEKDNVILIYGVNKDDSTFANDNGAGKTLICETVLYLLFGRTSKNTSKNLLVGKFDKYASINGKIEDDYGNQYEITRYIKHPVHKHGIKFKINGEAKTKGTATELSNLIERTLGISYRQIMNTSVFEGNDNRSRFIYLGDKDAKTLLLQMKGMDIFSTCYQVANEDYKTIIKANQKIKDKMIKIKWKLNEIKKKIKEYDGISKEYEQNRKDKIKEIELGIKDLKQKFERRKKEFLDKRKTIGEKVKKLKDKQPDNNIVESGKNKLGKLDSRMLVIKEMMFSLSEDLRKFNKQIDNLSSQEIGERCNKCGSIIDKKHVKEYLKQIDKEIEKTQKKYDTLSEELTGILTVYDRIESKINKVDYKISETNIEITKLKERLRLNEVSIEEKSIAFRTAMRYDEIKLDELRKKKNKFSELLKKEKKNKKKTLLRKKLIEKRIKAEEEKERYYKAWADGFGQEAIQNYALKSVVEELNDKILSISEILTDGLVDIKVLTEKKLTNGNIKNVFEIKITDLIKKKLPFKEWSKGQKKRIEIITNFALMNLEDNVLREIFLDEMFDGVDKTGITKILSLLNDESNKEKRFIVFSHSEDVKKRFTNYGRVTLKNGCSQFEIGV